jgi:hypothetical protein
VVVAQSPHDKDYHGMSTVDGKQNESRRPPVTQMKRKEVKGRCGMPVLQELRKE